MSAGFHSLRIAEVRRETPDAVSLKFDLPTELADAFAFQAGQHLTVKREIAGEEVRRNYSVCAAPHEGELRIAIKQIAEGVFSGWANSELAAGETLDVMAPHGAFTWTFDPAAARTYVAFAGGSGITPVLSLLKTALTVEPKSRFTLLYGNRSAAQVMFLEELAGLKNLFMDRLEVFHFLEEEDEDAELFNGRLDADKVEAILENLVEAETVDAFFICGPGPMMDAVEAGLKARQVPPRKILIERFITGPISAAQAARARRLEEAARGKPMTIILDGRRSRIAFDADKGSILDSARAAGLAAPFACKGGVCATCRARLVSGKVEMKANYALTQAELDQGYILTCQAAPVGEGVVLDYDG
ncbi:MAG TPA: 1,2-phenylacetyl-CoA epoxidase subunit PaaE [Caulobacteraceae bacterium]